MAFVLSSVSGNLISAASAGYAPTNSADVSAIASAYQVVSATATQLYAGTAYLTSVNGAPVSASRAGQAANASLANSAWYDGTGRFISALPDSAAVSAIASSYATGKQDTLAFAYNTANQISSINGSALGGMDEAAVSGIASAYAQSAASSKLDTSAFNSGDFYLTSNPSGFITGVDLTPYQPTSAMSAYATTAYVTSGLSGKENVFNAGTGLEFVQSGSDRVLQVEAPVDIVAGPGIVIDNPDGNTLRVSVDQAIATVLYDANSSPNQTGPWALSEVRTNFEWIDIVFGTDNSGNEVKVQRFKADSPYMKVDISRYNEDPNWKISTMTLTFNQATMSIKPNSIARYMITTAGAISVSTSAAQAPFIYQVIGIHRIAGGN